jgi:multicomponent Na+:H+ antiporter subunit E
MTPPTDKAVRFLDVLWRALLLSVVWLGLTGRDGASWIVGAPCVLVAAWLSARLRTAQPLRVSFLGSIVLLFYFLIGSLKGGIDVARRILLPRGQVKPGYREYTLRLGEGPARNFLVLMLNNMPGTLSAGTVGDLLSVHCIQHADANFDAALRTAEARVARAFSIQLKPQVCEHE